MLNPRQLPLPLVLGILLFTTGTAQAKAPAGPYKTPPGYITEVHLITIGPSEHMFTRFGHTALMVFSRKKGQKKIISKVFNYGDADFTAKDFEWRFFRGTVNFFAAVAGDLNEVLTRYARDNRTILHQKLNLTDAQVQKVIDALEHAVQPENRYYRYHHLYSACATKVRDVLDRILNGAIAKKLKPQQDKLSPRYYGRQVFAGHLFLEVFNDMFMGRYHDVAWSKYDATCVPAMLSAYLQEVEVPDPKGSGKLVPLADRPRPMMVRKGPSPTVGQGRTLIHLAYVWIVLIVGLGLYALRGQPDHPRRAGAWLMVWALPMGFAALCMLVGLIVSTVIEGRINELMLVYPPTDLLLIGVAFRWIWGRGHAGRLLRVYALVRLILVGLSLALHGLGIFFQEPRVLVVMGLIAAVLLVVITRRFPEEASEPSAIRIEPRV